METKRLKVLVIAHEFSPIKGSECAVGWNIAIRLAKYHNVTVLYASGSHEGNNSYVKAVRSYIAANGPFKGISFINIDQPRITKFISSFNRYFKNLSSIGLPVLYYWGYKYWQKSAFSKAIKIHEKENFDVVHQLTQITFREPGYWWKLGIPFVWGPTGGFNTLPKEFLKLLSWKSRIMERIRTLSNFFQFNYSYRVIKANKTAAVIYAYSVEDATRLRKRASGEVKLMLDVGTKNHGDMHKYERMNSSVVKGIWCGQLIERKAAIILLKALASSKLTREEIKFQIIGSGPLETALRKQSKAFGLNNIEWIGSVDHDTVFKLMSEADFFVHTSLREATSSVIPEALSTGLPVICHNANGMSIAINDTCGIQIPFISPDESVRGFHHAMENLLLNKKLLEKLKVGASKRSFEISWDAMAETMANDYTTVANKNSKKKFD